MAHYHYLIYSLFFLGLLATLLLWRRDLCKDAIPAFLFGAVAGPASEILYFSDYWRPQSVLHLGPILLEDVIFGIAIFGLTFMLYPAVRAMRLTPVAAGQDRHVRTFGTIAVAGLLMLLLMGALHLNSVYATAITFMVLWLLIGIWRPDLLRPGLIAGGMLAVLALLFYVVFLNLLVTPADMAAAWYLHGTSLGTTILGQVPLSELVWFFGTGCFLSIFELFVNKRTYQPR